MFEVGFTEILLILGLALLVLGPDKLPGLAEKVGRWTGRARAMARQLKTQLEHEVTMEELSRSRPMQSPPPPPPDATHAESTVASPDYTTPEAPPGALCEAPEHAGQEPGPGLDLDRTASAPESSGESQQPVPAAHEGAAHQSAPDEPAGTHENKVSAQ